MNCNLTTYTFVLGSEAANAVGRQLCKTRELLRSPSGRWRQRAEELAEQIERRLLHSTAGFEMDLLESGLTLVWQANRVKTAGTLYIVEGDRLKTINLILRDDEAGETRNEEIDQVAAVLDPLDGYRRALNMIRVAPRPLIATFCCVGGELSLAAETALLTFAAVFFSLRGDLPDRLLPCPVPRVPEPLNRAV